MNDPSQNRPLSPFMLFTLYKLQLTSVMSITHRITGIAVCGGLVLISVLMACLAFWPDGYELLAFCAGTIVGQLVLLGLAWSLFYHLCNGIRHMLWNLGFCLELRGAYLSGYIVIVTSIALTAAAWLKIYGVLP